MLYCTRYKKIRFTSIQLLFIYISGPEELYTSAWFAYKALTIVLDRYEPRDINVSVSNKRPSVSGTRMVRFPDTINIFTAILTTVLQL